MSSHDQQVLLVAQRYHAAAQATHEQYLGYRDALAVAGVVTENTLLDHAPDFAMMESDAIAVDLNAAMRAGQYMALAHGHYAAAKAYTTSIATLFSRQSTPTLSSITTASCRISTKAS